MYFVETGNKNGPTIVFIHGGGFSGWMWKKQVDYFKDYHCIVLDLPEHGKSTGEKFSLEASVEGIARLISEKANNGKAHVVGHSDGAKILVHILKAHSAVVDHAVVCSALFRKLPLQSLLYNRFTYKLSLWMTRNNVVLNSMAKQFKFPDEEYTNGFVTDMRAQTVDFLERIYNAQLKTLEIPVELKNVDNPTLIIAGEKEPDAMKKSVNDLSKVLSNSKEILLKEAQHNYPWTQYSTLNDLIYDWINNSN